MSINFIQQDITTSDADYICHQVNCRGVMNSGVAKAIRKKWPVVYDNYIAKYEENTLRGQCTLLGDIQIVPLYESYFKTKKHPCVINMFSQLDYGYDGKRYTSYDGFMECLGLIKQLIPKGSKIAFPYKIGCDRGGANWEIIYMMFVTTLSSDYDIEFCYLEEDLWIKTKRKMKQIFLMENG